MRAIALNGFGGPEVLVESSRPEPVPAAGEMLVNVTASGINRPDVLQRKGAALEASVMIQNLHPDRS